MSIHRGRFVTCTGLTAKKKVVHGSGLKPPEKLIKGCPTWENIVDNLTVQTAP